MGADSYSFECYHLGRGVLVAVKDVASHLAAKTPKQPSFNNVMYAIQDGTLPIPDEFTVLSISKRFLLLSPFGDEHKMVGSSLDVPGPYFATRAGQISFQPFSVTNPPSSSSSMALCMGSLSQAAYAITGLTSLRFAPGIYSLQSSTGTENIDVLLESTTAAPAVASQEGSPINEGSEQLNWELDPRIPRNVVFRRTAVGDTLESNLSVLSFYGLADSLIPPETLHQKPGDEPTLVEITPDNELKLLECYVLEQCVKKNGAKEISHKSDCEFLVGGKRESIRTSRAVLAMHNSVLCNLLYGTLALPKSPEQLHEPILLPDFDKDSVELVFKSLVLNHLDPIEVPQENELEVYKFLDYIDANPWALNMKFQSMSNVEKSRVSWTVDEYEKCDDWELASGASDAESNEEDMMYPAPDSESEQDDLDRYESEFSWDIEFIYDSDGVAIDDKKDEMDTTA